MKVAAITQARFGSSRLPGKVLKEIAGKTLLQIHLERVLGARLIDKLIVATTDEPEAEKICAIATACGAQWSKGSVDDVLDRFYQAVKDERADYIVRITSDCPLLDPELIDKVIKFTIDSGYDYCSNTLDPKYPDGQDIEVFRFSVLQEAWQSARLPSEREHVTPYIWKNSSFKGGLLFKSDNFQEGLSYGHLRMTVDTASDLVVIGNLIAAKGFNGTWLEYAEHLAGDEKLTRINKMFNRNEGYSKSLENENK